MNKNILLIENGVFPFFFEKTFNNSKEKVSFESLGTILSNLCYYGFVPCKKSLEALMLLTENEIASFWSSVDDDFSHVTGSDRDIGSYVVYKNFPREVLEKSEAEYWFNQILMYWGLGEYAIVESKEERPSLSENTSLKVLTFADSNVLSTLFNKLVSQSSKWNNSQTEQALFLMDEINCSSIILEDFHFKDNGVLFVSKAIEKNLDVKILDATNVLRVGAYLSNGNSKLSNSLRFSKFNRTTRKALLTFLENSKNLFDDISLRPKQWKTFFRYLRAGDYKSLFPNCLKAQDCLYNGLIEKSINAKIERILTEFTPVDLSKRELKKLKKQKNKPVFENELPEQKIIDTLGADFVKELYGVTIPEVKPFKPKKESLVNSISNIDTAIADLELLFSQRPNAAIKSFHQLYSVFGNDVAVNLLFPALEKQNAYQLLKFSKYISNVNERNGYIVAPNGLWSNAIILEKKKVFIDEKTILLIKEKINSLIKSKLSNKFESVMLDEKLKRVKLQDAEQELAQYGRGTVFEIPKNIRFIRTASYWDIKSQSNVWFDNGWNFFDEEWKPLGACCWINPRFHDAAILSGDPTIASNPEHKACQVIDLYLDELENHGIRYAVWNILSFNDINFSEASEVLATLQYGENPEEGELYEPSRAQMVFNLKDNCKAKYIAYIDVKHRKLRYLDLSLRANVNSANKNSAHLSKYMPFVLDYLNSKPSVYDLFSVLDADEKSENKILYSDKDIDVSCSSKSYSFLRENENNSFENFNIEELLIL